MCDVVCTGRFYDFLEKRKGRWGIVLRRLDLREGPHRPGRSVGQAHARPGAAGAVSRRLSPPRLSADARSATRSRRDMPGLDGPELDALYAKGEAWLKGKKLAVPARVGVHAEVRICAKWGSTIRGHHVVRRQIQPAQRIQHPAPDLRPVLHPAYLSASSPCRRRSTSSSPPASSRRRSGCIVAGAIETVLAIGLDFRHLHRHMPPPSPVIHLLVAAAAHLQGHEQLDLGDRRRRISACSGRSAVWSSPCTPITPAASEAAPHFSAFERKIRTMASVLFSPITMRGLTLPNRVVVSPMCQYNSNNGSANDWHLMRLGDLSLGAAGLVMTEMTDVNPQGRISPKCAGMYSDDNEAALKRVHDFCRQYGVAKLGVQLAHAGRKGTDHAAGGRRQADPGRPGRLDAGGAVGHPLRHRLGGAARHDQGRHQALHRRIRRRRQARRPHRLRRDRAARRARLSRAPVPVAALQQAHRRIWRLAGKPHALRHRDVRGGARGVAGAKADRHARLRHRLGRGRLDAGRNRRAGQGAEETRPGLHGRVERRAVAGAEDSAVAPATRCRSPRR